MARRQRDPALERRWRERLAEWRAGGEGVREFCLRRGLVETAFYYWRRELEARDAAAVRGSSRRPAAQGLVSPSPASHSTVSRRPVLGSPATPSPASLSSPSPSPASRRTTGKSALPMFVPVTVLPDTVLPDAVLASATLAVEVRCPSGHVVWLSACDGASLAALFAALEPRAPQAAQAPLAREARPC